MGLILSRWNFYYNNIRGLKSQFSTVLTGLMLFCKPFCVKKKKNVCWSTDWKQAVQSSFIHKGDNSPSSPHAQMTMATCDTLLHYYLFNFPLFLLLLFAAALRYCLIFKTKKSDFKKFLSHLQSQPFFIYLYFI